MEWIVENESNMEQYEVEKSADGIHFRTVNTVPANNAATNSYSWVDKTPLQGNNYYRIRSMDLNGKTQYSKVAKVLITKGKQGISIYPNPVTNGIIKLKFINKPAGIYGIKLLTKTGQVIMLKQIQHPEGNNVEQIDLNKIVVAGVYQLEITKPGGSRKNLTVSILR